MRDVAIDILNILELSTVELVLVVLAVFVAGLVRGFSGFALSALVMASTALLMPPIELIPVCWMLELSASTLMFKDGFKDADRRISLGLFLGGIIGLPLALYVTNTIDKDTSRLLALLIIIMLAALQLFKVRFSFLATRPGLYLSGVMAGIATGLAAVGGMVVALYVLSRDLPARIMRASLVLYLLLGSASTFIYYILYDMFTIQSIVRGLMLIIPCMLGVFLGKMTFMPRLEPYYKPFCLALLIFLALSGIARMGVGS